MPLKNSRTVVCSCVLSDLDSSGKYTMEKLDYIQEATARCHKVLVCLYQDLGMFMTKDET